MKKRIALFQYEWPLQSYSKDLGEKLAETGHLVDFYCYGVSKLNLVKVYSKKNLNYNFIDNNNFELETHPNKLINYILKIKNKIKWIKHQKLIKTIPDVSADIIDKNALINSLKKIRQKKYDYLIGIEKQGLIWAGILSELLKSKLIYYSLELYLEDMPSITEFEKIRPFEIKYHKQADATIVQDKYRAEKLLHYNHIESTNLILFPVSIRGEIYMQKSHFFHDKFNIPSSKKIILYFGMMCEDRYYTKIAEYSHQLAEDFVFVFHGYGNTTYIEQLKKISNPSKLFFSLDLISEEQIPEIISSADIGLSIYRNDFSNDRYTAFSSQKIALYMKTGVPIISMKNESYIELMTNYLCGEMIETIDNINIAANKIIDNYNLYRTESFRAYNQYYNFDLNFNQLINYLNKK